MRARRTGLRARETNHVLSSARAQHDKGEAETPRGPSALPLAAAAAARMATPASSAAHAPQVVYDAAAPLNREVAEALKSTTLEEFLAGLPRPGAPVVLDIDATVGDAMEVRRRRRRRVAPRSALHGVRRGHCSMRGPTQRDGCTSLRRAPRPPAAAATTTAATFKASAVVHSAVAAIARWRAHAAPDAARWLNATLSWNCRRLRVTASRRRRCRAPRTLRRRFTDSWMCRP